MVANIEANIVQNINKVSDGDGFQSTCLLHIVVRGNSCVCVLVTVNNV